jgi:hypothetical protein
MRLNPVFLRVRVMQRQARRLYEAAYEAADRPRLRSSALNNLGHLRYSQGGSDYGSLEASVRDYRRALDIDDGNVDAW